VIIIPKIQYRTKKLHRATLEIIEKVNEIIDNYAEQGYLLTVRQIFYQMVSRNLIENTEADYTNLCNKIKDGRYAGLIDWESIEDRTRFLRQLQHWSDPAEIIEAAANSYRINLWEDQEYYLEVWVEKDAIVGIVEQASNRYDVPCFSCRGYGSTTEYWNAAQRIIDHNRPCVILHLGDHDPSGQDMTRDIQDRLTEFEADVQIKRIALNMPQIELYKPPPQMAKKSDKRTQGYIEKHGVLHSWELDALEPSILDSLITEHILEYLDLDTFEQRIIRQDKEKAELMKLTV
jgi:hypothetical protein